MKNNLIGFWQDFTKNPNHPTFVFSPRKKTKAIYLEMKVVENYFLSKVSIPYDIRLVISDPYSMDMFGPFSTFTDGKYIWTSALIYYYNKHLVDISIDFKNHIIEQSKMDTQANISEAQLLEFAEVVKSEFIHLFV